MNKRSSSQNETARLHSLRNLRMLDSHPEERFDRITRLASRVFEVPIALLSFVDEQHQWFKSRHGLEIDPSMKENSFCGHAIMGPGILVVRDAQADPRFASNPLVTGEPRIRFYAGCPIYSSDGLPAGTLCILDRKPRDFSEEQLAILKEFASMVDQELFMLAQATTDELTRISNRRGFRQIAEHVLAVCRRTDHGATLIGMDLDGFKEINDSQGHEAGDEVLRGFAKLLLKHFRNSDVVARLGGDEFCVLTSGTSVQQAMGAEQRLAKAFPGTSLQQAYPRLCWSAGFAQFAPGGDQNLDGLMRAADEAMYLSKRDAKRTVQSAG